MSFFMGIFLDVMFLDIRPRIVAIAATGGAHSCKSSVTKPWSFDLYLRPSVPWIAFVTVIVVSATAAWP